MQHHKETKEGVWSVNKQWKTKCNVYCIFLIAMKYHKNNTCCAL